MYTITLNDGTVLENLTLNGNNFISKALIPDSVFENNLDTVTITDGEITTTITDGFLVANQVHDGESWFIIAEKNEQQKLKERIAEMDELALDHEFRVSLMELGI